MRRFTRCVLLVLCVGCSKPTAAPVASPPAKAASASVETKPLESADDKKLKAYKEQVANFIIEARAGVKYIKVASTLGEVRKKREQITELYSHVPDAPDTFEKGDEVAKLLLRINSEFAELPDWVKLQIEYQNLRDAKKAAEMQQTVDKLSDSIKARCTELEKLLEINL